ncbi:hypothetical protein Ae168Ps1_6159c [Pseudonocardia sp. Ae168_Ps1]|nr:hypothetical protein Ae150APs1_6092c [Pseudonocardia sp. Ae150A_Ps1]OLL70560.1 hypothetical protein Ae263Ps1_6310c [Pseudonocardia sp. Ae263_Ps1]OLL70694.1 hypothetical protein Ae168Ps1_6159c [Pseudonocardia sp. Ae168_Ps1]OLL89211.1 hypothetical protein Ae356Ps1_6130 [Pseudonocardia sp. Ae356_Ps1]
MFGVGMLECACVALSAAAPGVPRVAPRIEIGVCARPGSCWRRIVRHPVPVTVARDAGCHLAGVPAATARVSPPDSRHGPASLPRVLPTCLSHECSAVPAQGLRGGVSLWCLRWKLPGSSRACVTRAHAHIALSPARRRVWRGNFLAGVSVGAAGSIERPTRDAAAVAAGVAGAAIGSWSSVGSWCGAGRRLAAARLASGRIAGWGHRRECLLRGPVGLVAPGAWPVLLVVLDAGARRGEPGFSWRKFPRRSGAGAGLNAMCAWARVARAREAAPGHFLSAASAAAVPSPRAGPPLAGPRLGRRVRWVSGR